MVESSQPEMLFAKPCHCYWEGGQLHKCPYQPLDVSLQRIFCIVTSKILFVRIPLQALPSAASQCYSVIESLQRTWNKASWNVWPTFQCCPRTNKREWFGMMVIKNPLISRYFGGGGAVNHQLLLKQKWEGFSQKKDLQVGNLYAPPKFNSLPRRVGIERCQGQRYVFSND